MVAAMFPGESVDFPEPRGRPRSGSSGRPGDFESLDGCGDSCRQHRQTYAVSTALWDAVSTRMRFSMLVGHSLGFYAALYAAGSLGLEEGREVISRADAAIHEVASRMQGGMSAVVGLSSSRVGEICGRIQGVFVANINTGSQVVISGTADGLAIAEKAVLAEGALFVRRLAVTAPLHSPLLRGIEDLMDDALRGIRIARPSIPVINHIAPGVLRSAEQVREVLRAQFTAKVLWQDAVLFMVRAGVSTFVELGPTDMLSRIVRWIRRDVVICSPDDAICMEGVGGHLCGADGSDAVGNGNVRT